MLAAILGYVQAEDDEIVNKRKIYINKFKRESQNTSTPEKGVDYMRKNVYKHGKRWQYSKRVNGMLYYAIANTYRELLERIELIEPRPVASVKNLKTKSFTFAQYFEFYINCYVKGSGVSKETEKVWKRHLDQYILPFFKLTPLQRVTTESLQKFINNIDKERTREIIFQEILKVFKKAYVTGKIRRDVSLGVDRPKRKNRQERLPLTAAEQVKLLKAVKNTKLYVFTMFSLIVGSRREETLSFNLGEDLDEERQRIHIRGTKTENADRYVKISIGFINFLKENMQCDTFDFNLHYPTKELKKVFDTLKIKACVHSLRHSCATNLYFLGADDKYRQRQLGHASIVTTNDVYTNFEEDISKSSLLEIYRDLYPNFD